MVKGDKMDYEQLRKHQRREKNTAKLTEIPENFYEELESLIKQKEQEYRESMDYEAKNQLDNIRKIAKDLYKRRERKIITRALKETQQTNPKYHLVDREKKIFQEISELIEKERNFLKNMLMGTHTKPETKEKEETKEKQQTEEEKTEEQTKSSSQELNKVMVKILKEVPSFVSHNLEKLGPYQPNTKVRIPEKQAKILSEKGLAEKVKEDEDT